MTGGYGKIKLFSLLVALMVAGLAVVGGTWAWGVNYDSTEGEKKIDNGKNTLAYDVEFLYYDEAARAYTASALNTNIFEKSLWCPGRTEIIYLTVNNKEEFPVGISLDMVVEDNTFGADDLEYAVIYQNLKAEGVQHPESWSAFEEQSAANAMLTKGKHQLWYRKQLAPASGKVMDGETMVPADASCFLALAVHMNDHATNQQGSASIRFDIRVDADEAPVQ